MADTQKKYEKVEMTEEQRKEAKAAKKAAKEAKKKEKAAKKAARAQALKEQAEAKAAKLASMSNIFGDLPRIMSAALSCQGQAVPRIQELMVAALYADPVIRSGTFLSTAQLPNTKKYDWPLPAKGPVPANGLFLGAEEFKKGFAPIYVRWSFPPRGRAWDVGDEHFFHHANPGLVAL